MTTRFVTPRIVQSLAENGRCVQVIDVRTPAEYGEVHATMALNMPLDSLDPKRIDEMLEECENGMGYLICKSGARAHQAARKLRKAGVENVAVIDGGTDAWIADGCPVVRGDKVMSLERQVRIAAGSFVVLGVLLGFFVSPYFLGISAFVGAGLVFSGVTDTCGMGMLLSKMPWNQRTGA
ncbi:MAG: rhodanese-like domain-containing protein [Candidatus Hydrogenedentes bacterium]|nr:rhodanese-like domain-containing protein [Candidatus Hydrogenedentota bacterium]